MFVGLFALVLGLVATYAGWKYVSLADRMGSFRSVPGKVIARAVVVVPGGDTRTGAFGDGGGYMPSVRYRYTVDGAELEADKISFAYSGYKHAVAERKLAEIPNDVVVWYDPLKPTEAYLKKHTATVGIFIIMFGALVALGAVIKIALSFS